MEITFELIDGLYTAEFEVKSNCNIHVEREGKGHFFILQRGTKTGKYAVVSEEDYNKTTIDVDMLGNIYPKYIKITSASMPTYAEVNFAEEGGSGNSGDSGIVYIDLRQFPHDTVHDQFLLFLCFVLVEYEGIKRVEPATILIKNNTNPDAYIAGAFDKNIKIGSNGALMTIKEVIEKSGMSFDQLPFITEEEFYNLLNE